MLGARKSVDLDHLARYTGGDETINNEVLKLFNAQTSELVLKLQAILDARDAKSWKEITHTLKGAARGVGAFPLADAAAFAEPIDPASDRSNASLAISALKTQAEAVSHFITDYLKQRASDQKP